MLGIGNIIKNKPWQGNLQWGKILQDNVSNIVTGGSTLGVLWKLGASLYRRQRIPYGIVRPVGTPVSCMKVRHATYPSTTLTPTPSLSTQLHTYRAHYFLHRLWKLALCNATAFWRVNCEVQSRLIWTYYGLEVGYTLDRSPVYHRSHTQKQHKSM